LTKQTVFGWRLGLDFLDKVGGEGEICKGHVGGVEGEEEGGVGLGGEGGVRVGCGSGSLGFFCILLFAGFCLFFILLELKEA